MDTAHQICVFTAFSLVPRNRLILKCCLIHLKSNSTCQRFLYRAAMVNGGTIGDAVIMRVAFWCVAAFAGRYWLLRPKLAHIGSLVAVGVGITILIEKLAVSGGWVQGWSYSERMFTAFGIGITPVLQWIILPPLTIWFCKRQLGPGLMR